MTDSTPAIRIADRFVGTDHEPYLVAEMSGNHNRSLERALAIVDAAADAGAHAIKLQTYTADTMTLPLARGEFRIRDADSLWRERSLYDLYEEAHTPWDWHGPILERCRERGIDCFSSPFDASAVDFLEELGMPAYKIASFETIDLPLIRRAARTGKPLVISTGMATLAEIDEAVRTARENGCEQLALLQCTSTYPATPANSNLRTIPAMAGIFGVPVGLSDHTRGLGVAVASIALGATLIEKHFTLARAEGGVDAAFSLEPREFAALARESAAAWQALGEVRFGPTEAERNSLKYRRSLYLVEDAAAGDRLSERNLRAIRPGLGLPPKYYDALLGKRLARDASRGTPLSWDLIE